MQVGTLIWRMPVPSVALSYCAVSHKLDITTTAAGKGWHCSWMLNYPLLCFLVNGKYYSGMLGIPYMS